MTDAIIFDDQESKKAELDFHFTDASRLLDNARVVFASYFVDFCFFPRFQMLRGDAGSEPSPHCREQLIAFATANMAIV
jgi:hypothetical protein